MNEENKMMNLSRKKNKMLHGNYTKIDPHAQITSAFINQAITQVDGYDNNTPITPEDFVIQAKNWVDHNHK
ncbi:hypothetical protein V6615_13840 [Oscillospiraceae bacterium PP1C4]